MGTSLMKPPMDAEIIGPNHGCLDALGLVMYRGTSLIRNHFPLGPYSRIMPRALWWPYGGGLVLMSEVPL